MCESQTCSNPSHIHATRGVEYCDVEALAEYRLQLANERDKILERYRRASEGGSPLQVLELAKSELLSLVTKNVKTFQGVGSVTGCAPPATVNRPWVWGGLAALAFLIPICILTRA